MKAYGYGYSPIFRRVGGIDPQAQAHYDRVIADDGIIPAGLLGCNAWFVVVKAVYGVTDITTAISAGYDPHYLGAKIGAGSGTTLGQAATKLYSCSGASGDLTQATAASMPLLLVKNSTDANYAWFPGISTNYINSTTTYATNDIDIEFSINQRSGTTLNYQQVIGTNGTIPIAININRGLGTISFDYYVGGWRSCSAPFTLASTNIIRVTRNSTTGAVTFVNNGVTLTTSGAQIAGAFDSPITSLCVGGYTSGFPFEGRINYINCYISGVLNRTFNPASYNAATSQTQWTSTTGEVWTINTGTATTGYKGCLVSKSIVMGDALTAFMTVSGLTSKQYFTTLLTAVPYTNQNTAPRIISGDAGTHLIFKPSEGAFDAFNGVQLAFTGEVVNSLQTLIVDFNNTSSKTWVNNAGETSGSTGTTSSTSFAIFGSTTGATLSNAVISSIIQTKVIATTDERTGLYNALKTFNAY